MSFFTDKPSETNKKKDTIELTGQETYKIHKYAEVNSLTTANSIKQTTMN